MVPSKVFTHTCFLFRGKQLEGRHSGLLHGIRRHVSVPIRRRGVHSGPRGPAALAVGVGLLVRLATMTVPPALSVDKRKSPS